MSKDSSTFARCPACGHQVYHAVRRCPHCRHRLRWDLRPLAVWALAAAIAILVGLTLAELATVDDRPPPTPLFGNP